MAYEFGPCRPDELPALIPFVNSIFRTTRPGDMGAEYPLLFNEGNACNLMVARDNGKIVGHVGLCVRDASILGARFRVACIGSVGTDASARMQGIGSRLMEDARLRAIELGASLMLISGTRGLYHRLGYVQVGTFHEYLARPHASTLEVTVERAGPDNLETAARLYQAEPVRFFRSAGDWKALFDAGMLMNHPADLLLIRAAGDVVAYIAVQGEPLRARVAEMAGSRAAIVSAIPTIAHRYGSSEVQVVAQPGDLAWRVHATGARWDYDAVPFDGTLGVIDPETFLTAVRPLLNERGEVRLEPEGAGAQLIAGGTSVRLETMGELTALLFGGDTEEARALPELPAEAGRVFPLPLLWFGYNYV